jgi:hypothetical protein
MAVAGAFIPVLAPVPEAAIGFQIAIVDVIFDFEEMFDDPLSVRIPFKIDITVFGNHAIGILKPMFCARSLAYAYSS